MNHMNMEKVSNPGIIDFSVLAFIIVEYLDDVLLQLGLQNSFFVILAGWKILLWLRKATKFLFMWETLTKTSVAAPYYA